MDLTLKEYIYIAGFLVQFFTNLHLFSRWMGKVDAMLANHDDRLKRLEGGPSPEPTGRVLSFQKPIPIPIVEVKKNQ